MNGDGSRPIVESLRRDGYVVVPDVFDESYGSALAEALDRLLAAESPLPGNRFEGHDNRKVLNLLAKDRLFEQPPIAPEVLDVVDEFLGAGVQLSSISSLYVSPGEAEQPLHSDDQAILVNRHPDHPTICTTIWAIDDLTSENGTTRIVPGSHKRPERWAWQDAAPAGVVDAEPINIARGSVLIFDGACYHGAGRNNSDRVRRALTVSYCAGFIRPVENPHLGIPEHITREFSPRLLELCGYVPFRGMHGHVDRRAPRDILLGADGDVARVSRSLPESG